MKTYIITDSTSEISRQTASQLNIIVLPLTVHFNEESYLDGVDLMPHEFYEKLKISRDLPKTSQVSPEDFREKFEEILKDPENEIFGTFISSKLSGTYQSALIAREETDPSRIFLSDSMNATGGMGLLALIAADLRDKGLNACEIKVRIDELIPKVNIMMVFTTLKYLKAGGRISSTAAAMGGILKISPVVHFDKNGEIAVMGKVRGKNAAMDFLFNQLDKEPCDTGYPVSFLHSDAPEEADAVMRRFESTYPLERCVISSMGPVIGTHTGPGCFGIAYIKK